MKRKCHKLHILVYPANAICSPKVTQFTTERKLRSLVKLKTTNTEFIWRVEEVCLFVCILFFFFLNGSGLDDN